MTPFIVSNYQSKLPSSENIPRESKLPILGIIFVWLLLIGGVSQIFGVLFILENTIIRISFLVSGITMITIAIGLRKMRKWGLYAFTIFTFVEASISISSLMYPHVVGDLRLTSPSLISILILVYIWSIANRFR